MSLENARRLGAWVCSLLRKSYGEPPKPKPRPPLDELIFTVLLESASERAALQAYQNLQREFVDWNEVRVSTPYEIGNAIAGLPDPEGKARAIKSILSHVYAKRHELSLDFLQGTTPEKAYDFLIHLDGVGDRTAARVMLYSLNLPAMVLDEGSLRVVQRLGLLDEDADPVAARKFLEKVFPKESLYEAHILLAWHARRMCLANTPRCARCPLRTRCRAARARPSAAKRRKDAESRSSARRADAPVK